MKKTTFIKAALAFSLFCLAVVGCQDKPKQEGNNTQTAYELSMTEADTVAVASLVDQFFFLLEDDLVTDAVSMLYQYTDSNRYEVVELLDNENIQKVTTLLKAFPIVSHHIDYIKFHEVYANEVKVTAIIAEATDEQPEMKTVFYFRAVDDRGRWRLCMMNSDRNEQRIISNAEADAEAAKYSDYQKEKENQRNSASE